MAVSPITTPAARSGIPVGNTSAGSAAVSPPNYKPGPNAWSDWDIMVLADLGAKPTKDNLWFLDSWQLTEYSKAKNNPLNLTAPDGISYFVSSSGAKIQSYGTPQQGALNTANNIKSLYPTIHQMLLDPNGVNNVFFNNKYGGPQNLIQELKDWGSVSFANQLSGGSTPIVDQVGNAVTAPFKDVASLFKWMGGNWSRILIAIAGGVALLLGLYFAFKSQSNKTTVHIEGNANG